MKDSVVTPDMAHRDARSDAVNDNVYRRTVLVSIALGKVQVKVA